MMSKNPVVTYTLATLIFSVIPELTLPESAMDLPDVIIDFHNDKSKPSAQAGSSLRAVSTKGVNLTKTTFVSTSLYPAQSSLYQALSDASLSLLQLNGKGDAVNLDIRGFADDAAGNAVMSVNGVKQVSADQSPVEIGGLLMDNVKSLSIENYSDAVTYGDHAVGGVVAIDLKPLKDRDNLLLFSVGSYSDLMTTLQLKKTKDTITVYSSMMAEDTNNYRKDNQFSNRHIEVGMGYDHHEHHWQWVAGYSDQYVELPGSLTAEQMEDNPRQSAEDGQYVHQAVSTWELQGEDRWGLHWDYQTVIHARIDQQDGVEDGAFTVDDDLFQWRQSFLRTTQTLWRTDWIGGMDWLGSQYDYQSASYHPVSQQSIVGVFGKAKTFFNDTWSLDWGARLSQDDLRVSSTDVNRVDHQLEPATQIAVNYNVNTSNQVQVRRATSFRFPMIQEITWTEDGAPLHAETGRSYELVYHHNTNTCNWVASLSRLDLSNEIMFVPFSTSEWFGYNVNLAPTHRTVAQWSSSQPWRHGITLLSHLEWIRAQLDNPTGENTSIPFVPVWRWGLGGRYQISDHWDGELHYDYTGQRYPMSDVSNEEQPLSSYGLVDVMLRFHRLGWRSSLRVNNIFNQHYPAMAVLSTDTSGDPDTYYYPAPGINVLWTLAVVL